jgi:hypothetical protein
VFFIRNRFAALQNAADSVDGDGAPAGGGSNGPAAPDFDAIMKAAFDTAVAETPKPESSSSSVPPSGQPEAGAAGVGTPAAPSATTPAPAAAAAPTPAPAFQLPPEFLQAQTQTQQMVASALGAMNKLVEQISKPAEPAAPAAPQRLTAKELLKGFEAPERIRGEDDQSYAARFDQARLDHYTEKLAERTQAEVMAKAKALVDEALQQQAQQQAQRAQQEEGLRRFNTVVERAISTAGVAKASPAFTAYEKLVQVEMSALAPQIRTPQDFQRALQHSVEKYKPVFAAAAAPVAPAAPPTLVVHQGGGGAPAPAPAAPPIMGAGGAGPSAKPTESKPATPGADFNAIMQASFETWKKPA